MTRTPSSSRWRWALRLTVAAASAALLTLLGIAPASAHASLVSTDPVDGSVLAEAPDVARFTFDERITLPGDAVHVYDARGTELDASASAQGTAFAVDLPAAMAQGTYVVVWRIISADGHPVAGSLTFSVGRPSATVVSPVTPTTPALTHALLGVSQGVQYLALLLVVGLVLFSTWALPGGAPAAPARERIRAVLRWAVPVGAVAALLVIPLAGAMQAADSPTAAFTAAVWDLDLIGDQVLASLAVALGLLATLARHRVVALTGCAVAVAGPSLVGHTRAIEPTSAMVLSDVLHVGAAAVWLGGLVGLAVALPALGRRRDLAAAVLARFSLAAATVLALLLAAGTLLAWRILPGWAELWSTTYGQLLLGKIALVAIAVAIAGTNRFLLLPRVRDAVGYDAVRRAAVVLRRTVAAEAAVLLVAVALTGFLVDRSPRTEVVVAEGRSGTQTVTVGDHRVLATLAPARVGRTVVRVQVQDLTGEPVEFAEPPVVALRGPVDLGTVRTASVDAGTVQAEVILPAAGLWQVQVSLRISRFESPVTTLDFTID